MDTTISRSLARSLAIVSAAAVVAACADQVPLAPNRPAVTSASAVRATTLPASEADAIATLQRVTARYHDVNTAIAEEFVLLHPCENRPGEGPVGTVYVHPGRLMDGVIDPSSPDALIYEPGDNGRLRLAGVEFAIPVSMWQSPELPRFLGATFQSEEEFGVYALHAWVWLSNPNGLFAETNPRISCGDA